MRNIALTIQYEGTRYDGWQRQGNTANTIQGRLETLLSRLTGESVELHGAGRTDAGVHAAGQVANFHTGCTIDCAGLAAEMNRYLPHDIAVVGAREAAERFHSRLNAAGKHYRYRIRTSPVPDVFTRRYVWELGRPLDTDAMRLAAGRLAGRHDFTSFCDNRRMKKSAVRTVTELRVAERGGEVCLDFFGDGFLYHMARIMAGTLCAVGRGEIEPARLDDIMAEKDRAAAGPLAPAGGLCLMEVFYA